MYSHCIDIVYTLSSTVSCVPSLSLVEKNNVKTGSFRMFIRMWYNILYRTTMITFAKSIIIIIIFTLYIFISVSIRFLL